jgi:hypothetical protein
MTDSDVRLFDLGFFSPRDVQETYKDFLQKEKISARGCTCISNPHAFLYCHVSNCKFALGGKNLPNMQNLKEAAKKK